VLAALSLCAPFALGACDSVDGITPTCEPNVDEKGIHPSETGCAQFSPCVIDDKVQPATECCKDITAPLDHQYCMWTYGASEPPYVAASSSTAGGGAGGTGGAGGGN